MGTPQEVEIKLDVEQREADALRARLVCLFGDAPTTERLVSVYFDTDRQALRKHGLTLRIRTVGDRHVQTIKAGGQAGGGLFRRSEWEVEVDGDRPDLDAATGTPVAAVLDQQKAPLLPAFETVITRTTWLVSRGTSRIEVALDDGQAVANGRSAPILELELELKGGSTGDLFALVDDLGASVALRPGVLTKSERGYALLRDKPPRAVKAGPVPIEPGMTTAAAFQAILRACLRQFWLNERLLVETRGAEPLHQARVAMRRMRSALSLFKRSVADEEFDRLSTELRNVARLLGEVRDLDVYLAHALDHDAEPEVAAYRAAIQQRRERAFDRALAMLGSPAFRRLMLDLVAWIEGGPWLTTDDPLRRARRELPIEGVAAAMLDRRRRAVKRKGRHLDALDPPSRHRVRIAAKKLRYAAQFMAGLARRPKEQVRHARFIDAMETLQSLLGELNDIETGHTLAFGFAATSAAPATLVAAGHVSGAQDERKAGLLQAATAGHRAFRDAERFWTRWRERA